MRFQMCNVVWYDGANAYVSKFVLPSDEKVARNETVKYLSGNGEVLKIDYLYPVDLDNIVALKNGDPEQMTTYERFKTMFF